MQVVELAGDEWRLDLSVLDWSDGAATRLAAAAPHRGGGFPTCPAVAAGSRWRHCPADPWRRTNPVAGKPGRAPGPAAGRDPPLTGPWLPMADGARFDVRTTAGGAIAVDPLNAAAGDSLAAR